MQALMESLEIKSTHTHFKSSIKALRNFNIAMAKHAKEPTSFNGELTQTHKPHISSYTSFMHKTIEKEKKDISIFIT